MSQDPTDFNLVDQQQAAAREAVAKLVDYEAADLAWLMSQKRGRRVMWRLLSMTGLYRSSFTGNSQTFFYEGQRSVGLELLGKISRADHASYVQMMLESRDYK